MKLGAHCVLYGPEIASNTEGVIGRLAGAGAEGCELGERFFGVDERGKLTAILEKYNMRLAGMHCNHLNLMELLNEPEKAQAALEKVARFVAPLKDKNVIATGMTGGSDHMQQRTLAMGAVEPELHDPAHARRIAENLNGIAKEIREKYNVQIHYHNHSWEFADGGLLWFALAEYAPEVMFALDTGWASVSGYDPVALMDRYPGRFHYVHLRDYIKALDPGVRVFKDVHEGYVQLGTGDMDYPRLMRKLGQELGPEDWAIVEYEIGNFDANSYLQALSYLKGIRDML